MHRVTKVFCSVFFIIFFVFGLAHLTQARVVVPFNILFYDFFDSFNTNSWKTLDSTTKNFEFDDGSTGNCRLFGCIVGNADTEHIPLTYRELGVARTTGAFTVLSRSIENVSTTVKGVVGICVASSHCTHENRYELQNTLITDSSWHQYYIAWRPGLNNLEVCILVDDPISTNCIWKNTSFALGTTIDGVVLRAQNAYQADAANNIWFEDLMYAPDPAQRPSCSENCNSNVMFLPGIEGSRLYTINLHGEENQIWEPDSLTNNDISDLDLNNDHAKDRVYTKQGAIIDQAYPFASSLGTPNIYKTFTVSMNKMRVDNIIQDWEPIAYDWRLDYQELLSNGNQLSNGNIFYHGSSAGTSSPYIIQELKKLAASSRTGKVTVIAHSNGGLLAKALLQQPDVAQYVDKVILVASPQLGTPKSIGALLNGFELGFPGFKSILFDDSDGRKLSINSPMTYNLLPSTTYLDHSTIPVVTFNQSLKSWQSKYADPFSSVSGITTESGLESFMTDQSRSPQSLSANDLATPSIVSKQLFDAAVSTHTSLDAWVPPAGVQLITIAGWGQPTLSSIEYTQNRISCAGVSNNSNCSLASQITFNPKVTHDGDGTVQELSASWTNGQTASQFWIDLNHLNKNNSQGFAHANILESSSVETLLSSLLTNGPTIFLPDGIEHAKPTYDPAVGNVYFILHSPLTLGFKDIQGNYTGATADSIVTNVPDVTYQKFGEVQWLSVPKELAGQIVMQGTGAGSFTLDVQEAQGDTIVATTTFAAIPSATSTIATLTINPAVSPASSSTLQVDYNGDGNVDSTLKATRDSVVLPTPQDKTSPTTTAIVSGTKGTNGWFTSSVQVTFGATDTESGVASTNYSLDNATTMASSSLLISSEGAHTLTYYSVDKAGNSERATTTIIKIDKTAPEMLASASTSTPDLDISGLDNLSSTTILKTNSSFKVTDMAGNATTLAFTKTYSGKFLTYARLNSIQYGSTTPIALPSSYLFVWNILQNPPVLLDQTVFVDNQFWLEVLYDKAKNKSSILIQKKNQQLRSATSTGLAIIKLITNKGTINYSW